jgi:twinkle protein
VNAAELSARLASDASAIASYLLPQGKKSAGEWKAGSVSGEPGGSLSVRLTGAKAGIWKDFASQEGGDLIDLWAAVRNCSIGEAMAEAKGYLGINDTMPERPVKHFAVPAKPKTAIPVSVVRSWLMDRGLTEETIEAFKVREVQRNGSTWALFPYLRDGVYINGKYRNPTDKKGMGQEKDAEPCLFGWHLITPKARTIVITEGEIDAMTLHQAGVPALSVNAGSGNHQWIENDWDRLQRFGEIVICFDHDEAGEKGAAEVHPATWY